MIRAPNFLAIQAFLSALLVTCSAWGNELEELEWVELRTPNFRVLSVLDSSDTIDLVRDLEAFRAALSFMFDIRNVDASTLTTVYVLPGDEDFTKARGKPRAIDDLLLSLRGNTILAREVRGRFRLSTVLYEYVRLVMNKNASRGRPLWFDVGLPLYLSSARASSGELSVGISPPDMVRTLLTQDWLPMTEVVAPKLYTYSDNWRNWMFRCQSWAIVHYFLGGPQRDANFVEEMRLYLSLLERGEEPIGSFEEVFDIDLELLETEVKKHLRRRPYKYKQFDIESLVPDLHAEVAWLAREKIALVLGQLALDVGKFDKAERWFAVAANSAITRPQAMCGLGNILRSRGEMGAAQSRFEEALRLAPNDPYCHLDMGGYWLDRSAASNDAQERAELAELARDQYVEAWKIDDSIPEAYAKYGESFLIEGVRYDKAIDMLEEAERLAPSSLQVRLLLADAYVRAGQVDEAHAVLELVLAWSNGESEEAIRAKEIISNLNNGSSNQKTLELLNPRPRSTN